MYKIREHNAFVFIIIALKGYIIITNILYDTSMLFEIKIRCYHIDIICISTLDTKEMCFHIFGGLMIMTEFLDLSFTIVGSRIPEGENYAINTFIKITICCGIHLKLFVT